MAVRIEYVSQEDDQVLTKGHPTLVMHPFSATSTAA